MFVGKDVIWVRLRRRVLLLNVNELQSRKMRRSARTLYPPHYLGNKWQAWVTRLNQPVYDRTSLQPLCIGKMYRKIPPTGYSQQQAEVIERNRDLQAIWYKPKPRVLVAQGPWYISPKRHTTFLNVQEGNPRHFNEYEGGKLSPMPK